MDCNRSFSSLTNYNKDDMQSLTIFNLVAGDQLHEAFEKISHFFDATTSVAPVTLRSKFPNMDIRIHLVAQDPNNNSESNLLCVILVPRNDDPSRVTSDTLIPALVSAAAAAGGFSSSLSSDSPGTSEKDDSNKDACGVLGGVSSLFTMG